MSKPARYTVTLPPEMDDAVSEFSKETGISISDLARQGLIRVMQEVRREGSARLLKWEPEETAA
jgi:hypothetical protein